MTKRFIITVICWETRSFRHKKKAVEYCKNYGLYSLMKNLYVGRLRTGEEALLIEYFNKIFTNKTEKFCVFSICETCYNKAEFSQTTKDKLDNKSFKIVE